MVDEKAARAKRGLGARYGLGFAAVCATFGALGCECGPAPKARSAQPSATTTATARSAQPLPRIDVHLHIDLRSADEALSILREHTIVVGLNASGGEPGRGLEESASIAEQSGGALQPLCNLSLRPFEDARYPEYVRQSLARCRALGGKGLKIAKVLGLGLFDEAGELVAVDDPRLDVVFETAGDLELPVLLHSGDPKAFFKPATPDNERYDELRVHPGWSFHGPCPNGKPWPSWEAVLDQHERRVAKHPKTVFVGAHFGNAAEEPERVARMLRRYPNYVIDTAARVPEFGRHPAERMRAFFLEHQDRILFGSDLAVGPHGLILGSGDEKPGTRAQAGPFFERHFLYFETTGRGMPHPTPIQGRWTIDGIGLPESVLRRVYSENAARVFKLVVPK